MARRVTLKDVAARAGVSYQTVSKVVTGTAQVSPATDEAIWRAVQELGYQANVTARNLRKQSTGLIGYTWTQTSQERVNPILEQFLASTVDAAEEHGFHIMLFPSSSFGDSVEVYRRLIHTGRVDAFIVTSTNFDDPRIRLLLDLQFPFVAFGGANPEWEFASADVDGNAGIRLATEHLIAQGHTQIAMLGWPEHSRVGEDRIAGYLGAMEAAGLAVQAEWITRMASDFTTGYAATQRLLALPIANRPTAVVALDDNLAVGAMRAAQDAGLRVGPEFGVTGFDDTPGMQLLLPPLTSVRQPIGAVAHTLVTMLMQIIGGRAPEPMNVILKPTLVVRASSVRAAA